MIVFVDKFLLELHLSAAGQVQWIVGWAQLAYLAVQALSMLCNSSYARSTMNSTQ